MSVNSFPIKFITNYHFLFKSVIYSCRRWTFPTRPSVIHHRENFATTRGRAIGAITVRWLLSPEVVHFQIITSLRILVPPYNSVHNARHSHSKFYFQYDPFILRRHWTITPPERWLANRLNTSREPNAEEETDHSFISPPVFFFLRGSVSTSDWPFISANRSNRPPLHFYKC